MFKSEHRTQSSLCISLWRQSQQHELFVDTCKGTSSASQMLWHKPVNWERVKPWSQTGGHVPSLKTPVSLLTRKVLIHRSDGEEKLKTAFAEDAEYKATPCKQLTGHTVNHTPGLGTGQLSFLILSLIHFWYFSYVTNNSAAVRNELWVLVDI